MEEKTEFIVLRKTDVKDYDEIINGLSDKGQFSLYARSVKKSKSKNAYALNELSKAEVIYENKGEGGIKFLRTARLIDSYRHLKEDLDLQVIAVLLAELLIKIEDGEDLFNIADSFFNNLKDYKEPLTLLNHQLSLLLKREGIYPQINECVISGKKTGIVGVSIENGGFVSKDYINGAVKLNKNQLKAFRYINLADNKIKDELLNLSIDDVVISDILLDFLNYHLGINLKSRLFFDEYYQGKSYI